MRYACFYFPLAKMYTGKVPPPVQNSSQGMIGVSGDAYQVTIEEYGNYFESRYGLLHQKLNDMPFTGRILIIEKGRQWRVRSFR